MMRGWSAPTIMRLSIARISIEVLSVWAGNSIGRAFGFICVRNTTSPSHIYSLGILLKMPPYMQDFSGRASCSSSNQSCATKTATLKGTLMLTLCFRRPFLLSCTHKLSSFRVTVTTIRLYSIFTNRTSFAVL